MSAVSYYMLFPMSFFKANNMFCLDGETYGGCPVETYNCSGTCKSVNDECNGQCFGAGGSILCNGTCKSSANYYLCETVSESRRFRKPNQSKTNFSLSQNIFTQSNLNKVWVYLIQSIQICSNFFVNFLKQPIEV